MILPVQNLLDRFARTTEEVFSLQELQQLLASGRQLRIKYGVDLTAPHLHIGHAVNLWMMRSCRTWDTKSSSSWETLPLVLAILPGEIRCVLSSRRQR